MNSDTFDNRAIATSMANILFTLLVFIGFNISFPPVCPKLAASAPCLCFDRAFFNDFRAFFRLCERVYLRADEIFAEQGPKNAKKPMNVFHSWEMQTPQASILLCGSSPSAPLCKRPLRGILSGVFFIAAAPPGFGLAFIPYTYYTPQRLQFGNILKKLSRFSKFFSGGPGKLDFSRFFCRRPRRFFFRLPLFFCFFACFCVFCAFLCAFL
jgi:hypothetical protein